MPVNSALEPVLKPDARPPAHLAYLVPVQRVPEVVSGAVVNELDQAPRLPHVLEDHLRDFYVGNLVVRAEVNNVSCFALVEDEVGGYAVALQTELVAHIDAPPMKWQRFVLVRDEKWRGPSGQSRVCEV